MLEQAWLAGCGKSIAAEKAVAAASAEARAEAGIRRRQRSARAMEMGVDPAFGGARQLAIEAARVTIGGAADPVAGEQPRRQQGIAQDDAAVIVDQHQPRQQ